MAATLPLLSISQLAIIHYKLTSWETFRHIHILLVTCKVIDQHTSPLIMSRQLKKSVATSTQVIEEILKNYANETELLHLRNDFFKDEKWGIDEISFKSMSICSYHVIMWLNNCNTSRVCTVLSAISAVFYSRNVNCFFSTICFLLLPDFLFDP